MWGCTVCHMWHIQGTANSWFRHGHNNLAWSSVWCDTLKGDACSIGWHIHHSGIFIILAHSSFQHIHHSGTVNTQAQWTMWHSQHSERINIPAVNTLALSKLRHIQQWGSQHSGRIDIPALPSLRHDRQSKKDVTTAIPAGRQCASSWNRLSTLKMMRSSHKLHQPWGETVADEWSIHQEIGEGRIIHYNHWRGFDNNR